MAVSATIEPITEDDGALRTALADAHLPSLLPALAHVTGDMSLLDADLTPDPAPFAGDQGGLTAAQQERAREVALAALKAFREAGSVVAPAPSATDVRRMMAFLTRDAITDEYLPLLLEELAFPAEDARAPQWRKEEVAPDTAFHVAIIGGGMSGILAAIRLKQAGVSFTVLDKNADFGGTWFENTYPGARVDSSNHLYSYSFAQKRDWPYYFSTQSVLLDYFRGCADDYGIREQTRFETEVLSAVFDDGRALWTLTVRSSEGNEETIEANAVVSAVGQLNRPKMPDIPGVGTFAGPAFHSAEWDHSVDLTGKRVAVIGTGSSASQFIPIVAEQAGQLTIFQRTPNWYSAIPNYHEAVPDGLQWLFRHVPTYAQWYRFWLFWVSSDGLLPMARVEEGWEPLDRSVGADNDHLRELFTRSMTKQLEERPDLLAKVMPDYPPASKRIVVDNGVWPATLKRENVGLVTEPIREITAAGIRTEDGEEHAFDLIIYGTGFQASRFLTPMTVRGRGGADLHERWDGDARAYLGIVVPSFPNLFLLYGPNTNIVVNGSIVYFSECEVQYLLECVRLLLEDGHRAMDCRPEVHDAYNARVDAGNLRMAWGVSKVNSWYKNDKGRVAQNWPFSLLEYWQQTREANPADYAFL